MIVEVNEENIALFSLDKLLDKSVGELLEAAKKADGEGYVLTCRVRSEDVLEHNVFNSFDSIPAELGKRRKVEEADIFSWGDPEPIRTITVEVKVDETKDDDE